MVVVDVETTGSRAACDRVIEIAAVKLHDGAIVDRFQHLINPGCAVPCRIRGITGISTAMLVDQPPARDVLPAFDEFLRDAVFVAHNLHFDLGFVNSERRRMHCEPLANEVLCTLRLARRLLPGLRSKSLANLVDFYGIPVRRRHRALDDAEATASVLLRFLEQLEFEYGIVDLSDVTAFQYRRYGDLKRTPRNVSRLRRDVLNELPEGPGVYFMKDASGRTVYVGKARNIASRVRNYFTAVEGHPHRIRTMVRSTREVAWQETTSELEALLLESRLIKEMLPLYNRAQRAYVIRPFIRIDPRSMLVTTCAFVHADDAEYYGPFSGREEAACVFDVVRQFLLPGEDESDAFEGGRAVLDRVRAFLSGDGTHVLERIEAAMGAASDALDFERAALYRDWLGRIERLIGGLTPGNLFDRNAVLIHRNEAGHTHLHVVRYGRHVETIVAPGALNAGFVDHLRSKVERHLGAGTADEVRCREREVDEMHLLSHWLYVHRDTVRRVVWKAKEGLDAFVAHVCAEIETAVSEAP